MADSEDRVAYILRRNRELGSVLKRARTDAEKTIMQCAEEIGTYRQRYAAIERGEEPVNAAELEVLVTYLRIPSYAVWPVEQPGTGIKERLVYFRPDEGESLHIILGPYDPEAVPEAYSMGEEKRHPLVSKRLWPRVKGMTDRDGQ